MGEAMILEMLEGPKDLKQERKGGGGEYCWRAGGRDSL